jgi:hypothetical protein
MQVREKEEGHIVQSHHGRARQNEWSSIVEGMQQVKLRAACQDGQDGLLPHQAKRSEHIWDNDQFTSLARLYAEERTPP